MAVFNAKLIKRGGREGESIVLKDLTRIGRNQDNDIVLDTMDISRYHTVIEIKSNGYFVTDNASINGTFVNGERIETRQLFGGEIITFGELTDFEFVVGPASEPKAEVPSARLVVSGGELEEREFLLHDKETIIGRQEDCDIVIPHQGVSRNHARIIRDDSQTVIIDLESSNGTYVNGQRISKKEIKNGDTIDIDMYSFVFLDEREEKSQVPEVGISSIPAAGRVLPRNRTLTLCLVTMGILLCVGLSGGVSWYFIKNRSVNQIDLFRPIEVYTEKDIYRAAHGHIIRGLEEYDNSNLASTKEQFDIAIDILLSGLSSGYTYALEEREAFKLITRNLPENYKGYDLWQIYKETIQQEKRVEIVSEEERKAFAKQELKRILKKFGQDTYEIPPVFLNRVDFFINKFQHSQKGFFSRSLTRSYKYFPMIKRIFQKYNLPQELGYIAFIESGFNPEALSKAGARGMWQFMPATGRQYGLRINKFVDERCDPVKSTHASSKYIKNLLMDFGTDSFMLAMAAYNAGEGRVRAALRKGEDPFEERTFWHIVQRGTLKEETNEYVPKILAAMIISQNPAFFGFSGREKPNDETISVGSGTSLFFIAELCSATVDEIRAINPDLPPDAVTTPLAAPRFNLKIPYGFKKIVLAELDKLAEKRESN